MLDIEKFKKIFPNADPNKWFNPINDTLKTVQSLSDKGIACFFATIFIETNGLQSTSENLNYSTSGLMKVFPKYFTQRDPNKYARQPEKIANLVYSNRMGNGDEASGDGWKYRGRGILQLTGKNNYTIYSKHIGVDLVSNPDIILSDPVISVKIAVAYFTQTKCWSYAEKGDIKSVSGIVNAGNPNAKTIHGLEDRISQYNRILGILK